MAINAETLRALRGMLLQKIGEKDALHPSTVRLCMSSYDASEGECNKAVQPDYYLDDDGWMRKKESIQSTKPPTIVVNPKAVPDSRSTRNSDGEIVGKRSPGIDYTRKED